MLNARLALKVCWRQRYLNRLKDGVTLGVDDLPVQGLKGGGAPWLWT